MKISSDDQKAIGVILMYLALLFFLIGLAGSLKEGFESRAQIATMGFTAASIAAGLGVILIFFSWRKKRG